MRVATAALRFASGTLIALQHDQPNPAQGLPMPTKLDLVLIAACFAAVVGFIERGHRVIIAPPEAVEVATLASAGPCADDESPRFSTSRMMFVEEGYLAGPPIRRTPREARPSACESN
jgi:hypothetical protein